MPAQNRRNHLNSAWRWGNYLCSSYSPLLDRGRVVLRLSIVCALFSVCAGWALSGGNIARMADMMRAVVLPLYSYSGSWLKQEESRAVPAWDGELSEMRRAVETFGAREYTPPAWARNAHLNTIVASGDMEKKLLGDGTPLEYWRERWPTPDGDFVDIDWLPAEEPGDDADERVSSKAATMERPRGAAAWAERTLGSVLGVGHPEAPETVHGDHSAWMAERIAERTNESGRRRRLVVLLHGLEGSSTAPLTKRFSSVYARNGFDVAAVNFRGCGGELGKFPLGYHLGFTEDLLHVIEEIHRRFPGAWDRMYLSGFSLGGNVIIKFLGEQGDRARELGVYGASVACVPFEPQLGAQKLDKDLVGRYVYMPAFMAWLNVKAAEHAKAYPDVLNLEDLQDIKTFAQFDNSVTLPVFGFPSTEEYYRHVNAANYLSSVRVPLLVVNAKDDPFIDGDALPQQERVGDAPVRLIYHDYGGHCGFISGLLPSAWGDSKPRRWEFTHRLADTFGRGKSWNVFPWGNDGGTSVGKASSAAAGAMSSLSWLWGVGVSETGRREIGEREDTSDRNDCSDREFKRAGGTRPMGSVREGKWLPTELVRFVAHLDDSLHKDGKSKRDRGEGWDVAIEEL